jgi:hypothetical protein
MKDNRKNRNLLFIRSKNNLRLGRKKFKTIFNVSNLIPEREIADFVISQAKKELFQFYKLNLRNNKIEVAYTLDDFAKDCKHVKVTLFN